MFVVVFTISNIVSSFWLGTRLDQGSEATPVYFLPAGFTFAIWGLIFSSAMVYAIYQALPAQRERTLHRRIGGWVALNAALTLFWNITAGNAGQQGSPNFQPWLVVLTVFLLIGMLFSLTQVFIALRQLHSDLTRQDRWLVQFPTTLFFAWLNVAIVANTSAALVGLGFTGEPNGALWASAMLIVVTVLASVIVTLTRHRISTLTYSGVLIWAIVGIFFNQVDRSVGLAVICVLAASVIALLTFQHLGRHVRSTLRPVA
jgi:hypothetical protein